MPITYYGKDEVKLQTADGDYTILELSDGKIARVLTRELPNLLTAELSNSTELRRVRCLPIIQVLMETMKMYNIRQDEVEYILTMTTELVNQHVSNASNKLWNIEYFGEQTFQDIDEVLKR